MCESSYKIKHNCVTNTLKLLKADAILFVSDTNRFWITNIKTSAGLCLVINKLTYLIVDERYYNYCQSIKLPTNIKLIKDTNPLNCNELNKLVNKLKIKSIIVENEYLSLKQYQQIINKIKIKRINSINTDFLRIIKTKHEIELMKKSADIIVKVMQQVRNWLKPGISEIQTSKYIQKLILNSQASGVSFSPIVCFGKNTANPHHIPTTTILKNNQLVLIDIGCIYQGYCSDITRTFFIGNKKPSKNIIDIYKLVYNTNQLGIKSIRANIKGNEIDKICRDYISGNKKYCKYFIHALGHGIGINIHELPNCSSLYDGLIPKNSVVTIEPGIYVKNLGGVRIEDTVVVMSNGCINLTSKAPKDLF